MGTRALDDYMDTIEEGSRAGGLSLQQIRAKRHTVDHGLLIRPDQIEREARLNMIQGLAAPRNK